MNDEELESEPPGNLPITFGVTHRSIELQVYKYATQECLILVLS